MTRARSLPILDAIGAENVKETLDEAIAGPERRPVGEVHG